MHDMKKKTHKQRQLRHSQIDLTHCCLIGNCTKKNYLCVRFQADISPALRQIHNNQPQGVKDSVTDIRITPSLWCHKGRPALGVCG